MDESNPASQVDYLEAHQLLAQLFQMVIAPQTLSEEDHDSLLDRVEDYLLRNAPQRKGEG